MVLNKYLVLTISPYDERKQELCALIQQSHAPIHISQVEGFGPPELRVGRGEYVCNFEKIKHLIVEEYAVKTG